MRIWDCSAGLSRTPAPTSSLFDRSKNGRGKPLPYGFCFGAEKDRRADDIRPYVGADGQRQSEATSQSLAEFALCANHLNPLFRRHVRRKNSIRRSVTRALAPSNRAKRGRWSASISKIEPAGWRALFLGRQARGPAATRALPASLPSYLWKFFTKRCARSCALASHSAGSA